jgi:hypothetical protein
MYSRLTVFYISASLYISETYVSRSLLRYIGDIYLITLIFQITSLNHANEGH